MKGYFGLVMDAVNIDLFGGFARIKTVDIKGILDGVNELLQPATSGLVTDDSLSVLRRDYEANERPAPLGLVVIDYLFP